MDVIYYVWNRGICIAPTLKLLWEGFGAVTLVAYELGTPKVDTVGCFDAP
jgi:hypothetical protein